MTEVVIGMAFMAAIALVVYLVWWSGWGSVVAQILGFAAVALIFLLIAYMFGVIIRDFWP